MSIERISVGADRVTALVRTRVACSTPQLARAVTEAFPELPRHACLNDVGPRFGDVMASTSLPHMLEHVVISLQARSPETPDNLRLVGTTTWLSQSQGLARVEVSFGNDLVVLRAFRDGCQFLNETLQGLVS